jgi:hypothetical protein
MAVRFFASSVSWVSLTVLLCFFNAKSMPSSYSETLISTEDLSFEGIFLFFEGREWPHLFQAGPAGPEKIFLLPWKIIFRLGPFRVREIFLPAG